MISIESATFVLKSVNEFEYSVVMFETRLSKSSILVAISVSIVVVKSFLILSLMISGMKFKTSFNRLMFSANSTFSILILKSSTFLVNSATLVKTTSIASLFGFEILSSKSSKPFVRVFILSKISL